MTEPPLKILVSSAVYGLEELLDQVYALLASYGYEVWMAHKGTVPLSSSGTAFENCLTAVEQCDLLLCIITTRYGSGKQGDELSITHRELLRAIELEKPRWILAHDHVPFARTLLAECGYRDAAARERLRQTRKGIKSDVFQDLRIIDMYEAATRDEIHDLDDRTGNWVQKYSDEVDALLFASAQFSRYEEVRRFLEGSLKAPDTVNARVKEVKESK